MAECYLFTEDLCRTRLDTCPLEFVMEDAQGVAVDITGFSFSLALDTLKNPPDGTTNVWVIPGVITNALAGEFSFTPTVLQADQDPTVKYFYGIRYTDVGGLSCTFGKGKYDFEFQIVP